MAFPLFSKSFILAQTRNQNVNQHWKHQHWNNRGIQKWKNIKRCEKKTHKGKEIELKEDYAKSKPVACDI